MLPDVGPVLIKAAWWLFMQSNGQKGIRPERSSNEKRRITSVVTDYWREIGDKTPDLETGSQKSRKRAASKDSKPKDSHSKESKSQESKPKESQTGEPMPEEAKRKSSHHHVVEAKGLQAES